MDMKVEQLPRDFIAAGHMARVAIHLANLRRQMFSRGWLCNLGEARQKTRRQFRSIFGITSDHIKLHGATASTQTTSATDMIAFLDGSQLTSAEEP